MKKVVLTTNLFFCLAFLAYSQQLDIKQAGDNFTISIKYKDQIAINPPAEGLWSIATSWEDDWPASWQHATPTRLQEFGDWKILSGIMSSLKANGTCKTPIGRKKGASNVFEDLNGTEQKHWKM